MLCVFIHNYFPNQLHVIEVSPVGEEPQTVSALTEPLHPKPLAGWIEVQSLGRGVN